MSTNVEIRQPAVNGVPVSEHEKGRAEMYCETLKSMRTTFAVVGFFSMVAAAQADFVNGDFESGVPATALTGWTVSDTGVTFADNTETHSQTDLGGGVVGIINADQGMYSARIIPNINNASNLATFLGTTQAALNAVVGQTVFGGTAIYQDVAVNAGDTLAFRWAWFEDDDSGNNDFGFLGLRDLSAMSPSTSLSVIQNAAMTISASVTGSGGGAVGGSITQWQTGKSFVFTTTGTWRVYFGVTNINDDSRDANLWLDTVSVQPTGSPAVPEPASLAMLGMAGLVFSLRGLRRRQAA